MIKHSIYMVHDSGYDFGVKIGYIADLTGKAAWRAVPSYSPRPMRFDAVWHIPEHHFVPGISTTQSKERLEKALHRLLGGPMNARPEFPRTGQDWCAAHVGDALEAVSQFIGAKPSIVSPSYSLPTNDNFRNPHPRHLDRHPRKIVLWIYRELITGRLKVQFVDDWRTPFERARRYSRNGIEELAAFTYPGPATITGNTAVFEMWRAVVSEFGFGMDDKHYGWLKATAELEDVKARIEKHLRSVPTNPQLRPEGVKSSYNAKE